MELQRNRITAANSTFAIGGVSYSADSFVVVESFLLRIIIGGKNPAHCKSANRYQQDVKNDSDTKNDWQNDLRMNENRFSFFATRRIKEQENQPAFDTLRLPEVS